MWKPSTVEDIRKWMAGEYVPNPTNEEYWEALKARLREHAQTMMKARNSQGGDE